jgi:hypothetical protein
MSPRARRAGQFARSQARHHNVDFVRANLRVIALIFVSVYAVTLVVHRLWPGVFTDIFVGAMLVLPFWAVSLLASGRPGPAQWARGADAEEWTSTALRRALPKSYRLVNDVQLSHGNADHVIVGPAGVIVIETKWSGAPWASPAGWDRIRTASRQARGNARTISTLLAGHGQTIVAQPLVVLWGGDIRSWSKGSTIREVERTTVVAGTSLGIWAATLEDSHPEQARRDAIAAALRVL